MEIIGLNVPRRPSLPMPRNYLERSTAMAAGLADHVWSMSEWLSCPAAQHF